MLIFTAFNSHRGHEIERKNYLDDLKIGKWASQEQSESSGSNPGNSQFERRDSYQEWNDRRRPRYYRSRFSRSSNSDSRNWRNHRNGKVFHNKLMLFIIIKIYQHKTFLFKKWLKVFHEFFVKGKIFEWDFK